MLMPPPHLQMVRTGLVGLGVCSTMMTSLMIRCLILHWNCWSHWVISRSRSPRTAFRIPSQLNASYSAMYMQVLHHIAQAWVPAVGLWAEILKQLQSLSDPTRHVTLPLPWFFVITCCFLFLHGP